SSDVIITTGINLEAEVALIRRQTSKPSMPGIWTSRRTRSGGDAWIDFNALGPSIAERTVHSTPARQASISSRLASASSTTSTTGGRSGSTSRRVAGEAEATSPRRAGQRSEERRVGEG